MADIFISYKKTDHVFVRPIVDLLQEAGWSVWWDTRLNVGEQWDVTIEREIMAAGCVVVVWSPDSINSYWVREEARVGRERNILIPVLVKGVSPPFGYGLIQATDFTNWNRNSSNDCAARLVQAVELKMGPPGSPRLQKPIPHPLRGSAIRLSVRLLATTATTWAAAHFVASTKINYALADPWWTRQVFLPLPFAVFGVLFLLSIPNVIRTWNAQASNSAKQSPLKLSRLSVFRQATLWLADQPSTKRPSYLISLLLVAAAMFPFGLSPDIRLAFGWSLPSWAPDWMAWEWGWPAVGAALLAVMSVAEIAIKSQRW
jgi:hypothetical protein